MAVEINQVATPDIAGSYEIGDWVVGHDTAFLDLVMELTLAPKNSDTASRGHVLELSGRLIVGNAEGARHGGFAETPHFARMASKAGMSSLYLREEYKRA